MRRRVLTNPQCLTLAVHLNSFFKEIEMSFIKCYAFAR
ncbi:hypothetical protein T12_14284 [Trichinella patagoniensis]|uniref:Uncharacterized protein n=1 Tax=Trichinella patagoniensis TaxID=990121 RepID=A0A0V0YQP1_9BILA|nr:hypothetical protein T12_14284 [Trichinella patagoniensis]